MDHHSTSNQQHQDAWGHLIGVATAFRQSSILYAAIELDLFSVMSTTGDSPDDLAKLLGSEVLPVELLLAGLTSIGLLQQVGHRYLLKSEFRHFLEKGASCMGPELLQHREQNYAWLRLPRRIRGEMEELTIEEELFKSEAVGPYLRMVKASNEPHVPALVRFMIDRMGANDAVLDVGGGHGHHAASLLQASETAEVTVFDLPHAIDVCRDMQAECPAKERLHFVAGDALSFRLEEQYGVVMTSDLLHSFDMNDKRAILRNCISALKANGLLVVSKFSHSREDPEKAGPMLFSLKLFVNTRGGHLESNEDVVSILAENGITDIEQVALAPGRIVIAGRKASA